MAGIEVATGELVAEDAVFVFDFVCPKCGNNLIAKDKCGYWCCYTGDGCDWRISHAAFREKGIDDLK